MSVKPSAYLTLVLLGAAAPGAAAQAPRLDEARAAWKGREEKVRSARVEWDQTVFTAKGGESAILAAIGEKAATSPPEDHTYKGPGAFILDGDQMAVSHLREFWNREKQAYSDFPTEIKFTGERQLLFDRRGFTTWGSAVIRKVPDGAETPPLVRPLLRTFRGVSPKFRADDLDEYVATRAVAVIDGHPGHEMVSRGGAARAERRLWVDPRRGHVVIRAVTGKLERPSLQIDVQYKPDGLIGWAPTGWRIIETSPANGSMIRTTTGTCLAPQDERWAW